MERPAAQAAEPAAVQTAEQAARLGQGAGILRQAWESREARVQTPRGIPAACGWTPLGSCGRLQRIRDQARPPVRRPGTRPRQERSPREFAQGADLPRQERSLQESVRETGQARAERATAERAGPDREEARRLQAAVQLGSAAERLLGEAFPGEQARPPDWRRAGGSWNTRSWRSCLRGS